MPAIDTHGIRERFVASAFITKEDLYRYFIEQEPGLKDSTLRWRIHHLKESGVLLPVKRGVYELNSRSQRQQFNPSPSKKMINLYQAYSSQFSSESCALWSTEWLAQFMELQPAHSFIVFEIEKDLTQSLFSYLKQNRKDVFLMPDQDMMHNYVMERKDAIIVRPMVSRAPLQKMRNSLPIASLEKIMIDIFCDKDIFIAYQGSELKNIFNNAWKNYALNLSAMMNYAQRRKRSKELLNFLKKNAIELYKLLSK